MYSQADRHGHFSHVLPTHQLGTNPSQLALLPLWMQQKQGLRHHQPQHRIPQKLQALVIARHRRFAKFQSQFIGQRTVSQGAQQQLWTGKPVSQRNFQLCRYSFHLRLVHLQKLEHGARKQLQPFVQGLDTGRALIQLINSY